MTTMEAVKAAGNEEGRTVADLDHYLFPSREIARMGEKELLQLIEHNLPRALDSTDGSDIQSDVRIDIAQDYIEQARDRLVALGHVFGDEDRERLDFLQWPPTEAELREKERERRELEIRRQKWCRFGKPWSDFIRDSVKRVCCGARLLKGFDPGKIEIKLGVGSMLHSYGADRPDGVFLSGQEIQDLRNYIETVGMTKVRLGYGCSRAGISFSEDLNPFWSLTFALDAGSDVIRNVMERVRVATGLSCSAYDLHHDSPFPTHYVDVQDILLASAYVDVARLCRADVGAEFDPKDNEHRVMLGTTREGMSCIFSDRDALPQLGHVVAGQRYDESDGLVRAGDVQQ